MRKTILVILVLVLALIGGGFGLPASLSLERSRVLPCAPDAVFPHVNSLKMSGAWSPWREMDSQATNTFSGPDEGVGAKQEWRGKKIGAGTQEITSSSANQEVRSRLYFKDFAAGAEAHIRLAPSGKGTLVRWGFLQDPTGNPFLRYMHTLYVKGQLAGHYDRGLELLEKVACK